MYNCIDGVSRWDQDFTTIEEVMHDFVSILLYANNGGAHSTSLALQQSQIVLSR